MGCEQMLRTGFRRAEEAEMERKLAEREEAALMKEKQYATLDQEVKDTKKKLKKLLNKHEVMLKTTTYATTSEAKESQSVQCMVYCGTGLRGC